MALPVGVDALPKKAKPNNSVLRVESFRVEGPGSEDLEV